MAVGFSFDLWLCVVCIFIKLLCFSCGFCFFLYSLDVWFFFFFIVITKTELFSNKPYISNEDLLNVLQLKTIVHLNKVLHLDLVCLEPFPRFPNLLRELLLLQSH